MKWQLDGKVLCLCRNLLMLVNDVCKAPVKQKLSWIFKNFLNLAHEWQFSHSGVKEGLLQHSFKSDLTFLTACKTEDWDCERCAGQEGCSGGRKPYVHKESWGRLGKKAVALLEALVFMENEYRLVQNSPEAAHCRKSVF